MAGSYVLLNDDVNVVIPCKNYEKVCEMCLITLNKSAIFCDNGAINENRGSCFDIKRLFRGRFETIADFLLTVAQIPCAIQREHGNFGEIFSRICKRTEI
ncbi:serine hydroxymethyltransferase 7-like [Manihot esculenta]|uniref:serine hydroxymethyltransferase 7-like n=1 Tax=Manihot esculenta TaxID=3983 RepID=UPI001CC7BA43|nr:serine hydroxymethyltransferase 7-like [Manihot esculenta]